MKKNESVSMFSTDNINNDIAGKMGISFKSQVMQGPMTPNILKIFEKAEKDLKKTELNLTEITVAYYNMYTPEETDQKKIKSKNDIAVKLYRLRKMGVIESVPMSRGLYRLSKKFITE